MTAIATQKFKPRLNVRLITGLCIAILTTTILLCLENHYRQSAPNGYFQQWTSETMWQTVSIEDLRDQPLQSLWYLHIQPPMYDIIRTVLAQFWKMDDSMAMLLKVDHSLYYVWALVYGLFIFMLYWWLSKLTNIPMAAISTLFFSVHPALIFYATMLDTTLLSAFLILLFYYFLWRVKKGHTKSVAGLIISFLLLYFTRSLFQWQWLLLMALSLMLMKLPLRKLILFLSITGAVIGLYTAKQLALFDLSSTSSFSGLNLCQSIECSDLVNIYDHAPSGLSESADAAQANVLKRVTKITGNANLNNPYYLALNRQLLQEYKSKMIELIKTPRALIKLYYQNLQIYLSPSSQYISTNIIVENLPQRSFYDAIFSFPILLWLLTIAFILWVIQIKKTDILPAVGFVLPALFIIFLCIVGDRGENMRFKFFIEPVLFVFISTQIFAAGKAVISLIRRKSVTA